MAAPRADLAAPDLDNNADLLAGHAPRFVRNRNARRITNAIAEVRWLADHLDAQYAMLAEAARNVADEADALANDDIFEDDLVVKLKHVANLLRDPANAESIRQVAEDVKSASKDARYSKLANRLSHVFLLAMIGSIIGCILLANPALVVACTAGAVAFALASLKTGQISNNLNRDDVSTLDISLGFFARKAHENLPADAPAPAVQNAPRR